MRRTLVIILILLVIPNLANAFWIWTPKSKKFINPKYAVKDTPDEQYHWAMSFFEKEDYKRAAGEFVRLVQYYKNSELAPDAQYYAALSYQRAGKRYIAFQNYQKVIKDYPFSKRIDDIIKAEYELGQFFFKRSKATLMGMELMADVERGIEVFSAIIENTPYSTYADDAQYMIGLSYKKIMQYNDAVVAFQKLVQEYPTSDLLEKAKYEVAQCMYLESKKPDYDQETTDEAIEEFRKIAKGQDKKLQEQAEHTIHRLREKKAESIFKTADFYEKRKKYRSAYIYYNEIVDKYGDTYCVPVVKERLKYLKVLLEGEDNE